MSKVAEALKNVIVVTPVVRIWSGQVTLKRDEDLSDASGLPPTGLVVDGSKRVIDPRNLTPLESQRRAINHTLSRIGVRSPMGYLITPDMEGEVHAEMQARGAKFNAARQLLIDGFPQLCAAWEAANPGFESLLQRNRPTAQDVAAACDFDYAIYRVGEVESSEGSKQFEAVAKATTSSLADDIASTAKTILNESFRGKTTITQKAVNLVRALVKKLRSFTMFDARIGPTADAMDSVLSVVRLVGPLDANEINLIKAMLNSITNASSVLAYGECEQAAVIEQQQAGFAFVPPVVISSGPRVLPERVTKAVAEMYSTPAADPEREAIVVPAVVVDVQPRRTLSPEFMVTF